MKKEKTVKIAKAVVEDLRDRAERCDVASARVKAIKRDLKMLEDQLAEARKNEEAEQRSFRFMFYRRGGVLVKIDGFELVTTVHGEDKKVSFHSVPEVRARVFDGEVSPDESMIRLTEKACKTYPLCMLELQPLLGLESFYRFSGERHKTAAAAELFRELRRRKILENADKLIQFDDRHYLETTKNVWQRLVRGGEDGSNQV